MLVGLMSAVASLSAQEVMTRQNDGTVVVYTATLAKDVRGYQGPTPVHIYIDKKGIIQRVVADEDHMETPKHFVRVKRDLLPKYEGVAAKKIATLKVDGVTGATYTSSAIKENIARGVDYYLKNKKKK